MCLAQRPQRSDDGEARTRGPLVSSQALYHWATKLPDGIVHQFGQRYYQNKTKLRYNFGSLANVSNKYNKQLISLKIKAKG